MPGDTRLRSVVVDVVIDCDPGIDDAIAIAYLTGEQSTGRTTLAAVTTVRGNLGVAETGRNAAFVLDRLGFGDVPVRRGAAEPLTTHDSGLNAIASHGGDGLGGLHDTAHPDRAEAPSMDRVFEMLGSATRGAVDGQATGSTDTVLLATASLTNIASWFAEDPSAARSLRRLVVMGGAFGDPPGNITGSAEYNFHLDPVAAARVMASGAPITLVPLDVTSKVLIRPDDLERLSDSPRAHFVRRLLEASIRINGGRTGLDGCMVHDALAAAVAVDPSLVECVTGHVEVTVGRDKDGHSRLVPSPDGPVRVALAVDAELARNQIMESLARL